MIHFSLFFTQKRNAHQVYLVFTLYYFAVGGRKCKEFFYEYKSNKPKFFAELSVLPLI